MATLSITLPQELVSLLEEKVASGMYHSVSEVVGESLQLLKEHDEIRRVQLEALRKELALAEKQIENGQVNRYTKRGELAEKIVADGKRVLAQV